MNEVTGDELGSKLLPEFPSSFSVFGSSQMIKVPAAALTPGAGLCCEAGLTWSRFVVAPGVEVQDAPLRVHAREALDKNARAHPVVQRRHDRNCFYVETVVPCLLDHPVSQVLRREPGMEARNSAGAHWGSVFVASATLVCSIFHLHGGVHLSAARTIVSTTTSRSGCTLPGITASISIVTAVLAVVLALVPVTTPGVVVAEAGSRG